MYSLNIDIKISKMLINPRMLVKNKIFISTLIKFINPKYKSMTPIKIINKIVRLNISKIEEAYKYKQLLNQMLAVLIS